MYLLPPSPQGYFLNETNLNGVVDTLEVDKAIPVARRITKLDLFIPSLH